MLRRSGLVFCFGILAVGFPLLTSGTGPMNNVVTSTLHRDEGVLKLGVMCALPKELGVLADEMDGRPASEVVGMREYVNGNLWGLDTILATSRVGKVAAATTATHLIESREVDAIIYLGVAGAMNHELSQGDIVIGERLIQYDMDSRPLTPQFAIPLLNISEFESDSALATLGALAAEEYLLSKGQVRLTPSQGHSNKVYKGLIGTGDRFVSRSGDRDSLRTALPTLLAVDMEGAAVAQVCYEHGVPFVVIRTISDSCDEDAAIDCMTFLKEVAPAYTRGVLWRLYALLQDQRDQA